MADSPVVIVLMIATAAVMAGGILVVTHTFGRFAHSRVDKSPYECGMRPYERVAKHRFSVHFYLVAMLFILFDIEAAFLFPWAVTFKQFAEIEGMQWFVLGEMAVFLGILIAGFVYVWKRGALEWE